jgi:3-deoxy-D-manno-octulosonic-acid transferase
MIRALYNLLFILAVPLVFARLWWRGRKQPLYRQHWRERLGYLPFKLDSCVWIHVVSLGESMAAKPVIEHLIATSSVPVLVTNTTASGREYVAKTFGVRLKHAYFPYDIEHVLKRFMQRVNPKALILMETEVWPNLLALCAKRGIQTLLANARLSARSAAKYAQYPRITKPMFAALSCVCAQTQADAERFAQVGVKPAVLQVTGSIKFDLQVPDDVMTRAAALQKSLGKRPVWIAASTHNGEELIALQAHRAVLQTVPEALLILVPRHPDRFNDVAQLIAQADLPFVRRSEGEIPQAQHAVFLGDTLGELLLFYACGQIAFIGGSFVPVGGHNPLEPAAVKVGSLTGPTVINFQQIFDYLIKAGAAEIVEAPERLGQVVIDHLQDTTATRAMGEAAYQVVQTHRGALQRLLPLIDKVLV